MTWRGRRRGVFEGPPRVLFRRAPTRYFEVHAAAIVLNGVVVAAFGAVVVALYVDLRAGELAVFAACSAAGFAVEGLVAGLDVRRWASPVRAWLAGDDREGVAGEAWSVAA